MTGRGPDGAYLDPDLLLPLVRRQHVLEHQSWGADFADGVAGEANVLRLRRSGNCWLRLGDCGGDGVTLPAETVRQHGLMLQRIADDLEGGR